LSLFNGRGAVNGKVQVLFDKMFEGGKGLDAAVFTKKVEERYFSHLK